MADCGVMWVNNGKSISHVLQHIDENSKIESQVQMHGLLLNSHYHQTRDETWNCFHVFEKRGNVAFADRIPINP